jgi:hypothetical protein
MTQANLCGGVCTKNGDPKAAVRNVNEKTIARFDYDNTNDNYTLASIWVVSYCGNYLLTLIYSDVVII